MSIKILEAVRNSHYSQLDLFIRHNYNFRIKSPNDGCNCLLTALQIPDAGKRYRMFEFLLNQDLVDILDQDKNGHDVFFATVIREYGRELDLLMKYFHMEIDWSRTDNFGKTLLHYAVVNNNLEILETLLNYCSKYKINVDIPDKINKITPYLLACRLNHQQSADLLLQMGHASKMQVDQSSFYDAERWKQEGQIEKLKNYLKLKENEMNVAKLSGNMKLYKELNILSKQLGKEVIQNTEILPVLAKIIIDHDNSIKNNSMQIKQTQTPKGLQLPPTSSRLLSRSRSTMTSSCKPSAISAMSVVPNANNQSGFMSSFSLNNDSTVLSFSNSKSKSGLSSSPNVNLVLKQAMNTLIRKRAENESPQVNSLLEMTDGQTNVDHFVGSKSDPEQSDTNSVSSHNNNTRTQQNASNNTTHTSYHHIQNEPNHMNHQHHHFNHQQNLIEISNVFYAAALQKTGNYRVGAVYNSNPIKFDNNRQQKQQHSTSHSKSKSNLSSFKLISITEESHLSNYARRTSPKKYQSEIEKRSLTRKS